MTTSHRTPRPLVTYAGAVCIAFLGTWGVTALEARRPTPVVRAAPTVRAPAVIVEADEPPPSRDSIAALLVSSPRVHRAPRGETALLRDVLAVTEHMSSWTERAAVLAEIAELPVLDSSIVTGIGRASSTLPSPSARSRVLRTLIQRHPHAVGASRGAVLSSVGSMISASERASVLEVFLTRPRLTQPAIADALTHVGRLPANSDRASVLMAAARSNRMEGRARSLYVQAATGISSNRQRSRVLSAIGARIRTQDDAAGAN